MKKSETFSQLTQRYPVVLPDELEHTIGGNIGLFLEILFPSKLKGRG